MSREYGGETWDRLLANAGVEGAYTSLGSYRDEEFYSLVKAASSALDLPPDTIVRWFGQRALPLLAQKYPRFFAAHRSTRAFLLTLNDIIHPEVRKLYPGAQVPTFGYDISSDDFFGMTYQSPRQLCALAEGLILGAAEHYGESVAIEHTQCMKRGNGRCAWRLVFSRRESSEGARAA